MARISFVCVRIPSGCKGVLLLPLPEECRRCYGCLTGSPNGSNVITLRDGGVKCWDGVFGFDDEVGKKGWFIAVWLGCFQCGFMEKVK
ncbi:hypothetical protein CEXT_381481 [Caerostris extrusa]|uniref:Uncharacterized protein n=1 Tax=Caerostris extrusa TaxID=172846 RepID=A0AAV4XUL4_CAEEX|nr:hypothetical protein CEXT_381481 [Caerostris extrusa]